MPNTPIRSKRQDVLVKLYGYPVWRANIRIISLIRRDIPASTMKYRQRYAGVLGT